MAGAVRAVPAHRPAVGPAAGRRREHRAVGHDAHGRHGRGRRGRLDRPARALLRRRRRGPTRCTSAARCCPASTAASGRGCASSVARGAAPAAGAAAARRAGLRYEMTLEPQPPAPAAAARDDARPRRRRAADRRLAARRSGADCSGRPTARWPSACASRPPPGSISATARAVRCRACATCWRCRPASTRAPSHWAGSCAGAADLPLPTRAPSPPRCCSTSAAAATPTRWTPGAYGADAIDEFWLDRKRGFCEHFASRLRRRDAGDGRAGARSSPATRAPTPNRWTASGSCARAMPMPGPRSGSPARAGCASTRPRPSRPTASSAAAAWRRRRAWSPARSATSSPALATQAAQRLGSASTTAGTSGC